MWHFNNILQCMHVCGALCGFYDVLSLSIYNDHAQMTYTLMLLLIARTKFSDFSDQSRYR